MILKNAFYTLKNPYLLRGSEDKNVTDKISSCRKVPKEDPKI